MSSAQSPLTVCVSGAAGQIAYALLPTIASGRVFGPVRALPSSLLPCFLPSSLPLSPLTDAPTHAIATPPDCPPPLLPAAFYARAHLAPLQERRVALKLLDIPPMEGTMKGVEMELLDGAYPLLASVWSGSDADAAFTDCDVIVPRDVCRGITRMRRTHGMRV